MSKDIKKKRIRKNSKASNCTIIWTVSAWRQLSKFSPHKYLALCYTAKNDTKGEFVMNNTNNTRESRTEEKRGCLALAPTGERLIASLSVLGWLTFLIKFAIV